MNLANHHDQSGGELTLLHVFKLGGKTMEIWMILNGISSNVWPQPTTLPRAGFYMLTRASNLSLAVTSLTFYWHSAPPDQTVLYQTMNAWVWKEVCHLRHVSMS
jgi:hypothetical protein